MASSPADLRASFPLRQGALILSSQLGGRWPTQCHSRRGFQGEGDGGLYTEWVLGGVRPPQNTDGRMHAWGQTPRESKLLKPGQAQKTHQLESVHRDMQGDVC